MTVKSILFGRDAGGQRDRARHELRDAQRSHVDLQKRRDAMLADGETTVVDLRKVDIAVGEQQAAIALLEQRIAHLGVAVRKERMAKLEAARTAALARVVEPQFAQIEKLAADLELAITMLADSFGKLKLAEQHLNATWPQSVVRPQFWSGAFSTLSVTGRIKQALRMASAGAIDRLAEFTRYDSEHSIAESIKRQLASSLNELRAVPLHLPEDDDAPDERDVAIADAPAMPEPTRGLAALATN
jgi:hypothetical protein